MASTRRRQDSDVTSPQSNSDVERLRQEVERIRRALRLVDQQLQTQIDAIDTSGGGGAPVGASYVTISADATLTAERTIAAGAGITITDGGANSTVTIATTITQTTQEQVEDWVGGMSDPSATIVPSYDDAGASLTWDVDESGLVLWEQVQDIDCAAEAASDWNAGGDGNYSLGGLTWEIVNTGVADTFGPDGSTGVRFNASANATVFNNSSKTATHMWIAALSLDPNFDPLAEYVVEFGYSSLTLGTSSDEVGCFFWSSNSNRTVRAGRRNTSGSQQTSMLLDGNANGTTGYTDTAFALRINACIASIASGAFAAGAFPTLYPHLGSQVSLAGTSPLQSPIFDPPTLRIGFAWCSNVAGNADSTLARIRVWRRRGMFG